MKILIVRTTPNEVNLNLYNLQEVGLAKALVRKGHSCDVMYYSKEKEDRVEILEFDQGEHAINILWLHGYGRFYEGIYPSLGKYTDAYDIIQVSGYIGITSCWLNRHAQGKVINYDGQYYYRGNKGDRVKAMIWDHLLLPFSHKKKMIVAAKSELSAEYLRAKGIENVHTIGVGLDTDRFSRRVSNTAHPFTGRLEKEKGNQRYLLYIGRIEKRRNILFLLDVFNSVRKICPDTKLVMIGDGKADYVCACRDKIRKLGLQNKVIWRTSLEQKYLRSVYELSDLFLLPTRYEIFGMVLLEAMYFGVPVLTSLNGGSNTLLDGNNGIIIKNFVSEDWCRNILALLNSQTVRKKMGEEGKRTIQEGYTWDILAEKFLDIYRKRLKDEGKN